ncbi:MAG: PAS domain S-box protein [Deltaproteobacteria bacterium]|nr:PAS domain S-box protein [Deltaproteobacteria bacterium]
MNSESISREQLLAEVEKLKKQIARFEEAEIECRAVELDLKRKEEKLRLLFQEMLSGFALHEIVLDEEGKPCDYRFLEVNPAFEKLTGLKSEEIIGRNVTGVLPGIEPYWIEAYGKVALSGEPTRFENYSQSLDKHYAVTAYCPQKGQFAVVFVDITDRKRVEENLQKANQELSDLNHKLEERVLQRTQELIRKNEQLATAERLAAVGRMANRVAHELRNPLTVVGGFAQRVYNGTPDDDPKKKYCDIILGEIEVLEKKVAEITQVSKEETG